MDRKNDRKRIPPAAAGGFCAALIVLVSFFFIHRVQVSSRDVVIDPQAYYQVSKVVDGDTIRADVSGKEITVRLLGINTPETVDPRKPVECYGPEASKEAKWLLEGHSVKLIASPNRETHDKYGRYLLYVYRDDGLSVNEFLVKEGFAREYTVGKAYSLQTSFRKLETEAKTAKKGLWGACDDVQLKKPRSS